MDDADRLRRHHMVPGLRRCRATLRQSMNTATRGIAPSGQFKPPTISSFVRNKQSMTVYLGVISDNLAKQMGTRWAKTAHRPEPSLMPDLPKAGIRPPLFVLWRTAWAGSSMKIKRSCPQPRCAQLDPGRRGRRPGRNWKLNLALGCVQQRDASTPSTIRSSCEVHLPL